MSAVSDFTLGRLPVAVEASADKRMNSLHGEWVEICKDSDAMNAIFARLGLGGIKRRMICSRANRMELHLLSGESWKGEDRLTFSPEPTTDVVLDEENTESPTISTQPTSPLRMPTTEDMEYMNKVEETNTATMAKWWQKQYFPLGRFLESTFLTDGSEYIRLDSETGEWCCRAEWRGGVLYQVRYSEKHEITMYETRCVLKDVLFDFEDISPSLKVFSERNEDLPIQIFQWKLIDHRKEDFEQVCYCVLQPSTDVGTTI